MTTIERPSATDLFEHVQNQFSATVLGGGAIIPESNEWYVTALNYAMMEELFAIMDQSFLEMDPETACDTNMLEMAERDGLYPTPAIPSQGYLKLTGVAGATLTSPLNFTVGGQQFITALEESQPGALDSNGEAYIRVRAVVPGAGGNITAIDGTLDTAVTDVDTDVTVAGGSFCGGYDSEDLSEFRSRYIERLSYKPRATMAWMLDKLAEWPCATRVVHRAGSCCECGCDDPAAVVGSSNCSGDVGNCEDCGCVECGGRMHFYVMFDDTFENGIAPSNVLAEIETWMFGAPQGFGLGEAEIGICGRIVSVTGVPVKVYLDVSDCPSASQLALAEDAVSNYFATVEPSQPLDTTELRTAVNRAMRVTDAAEVRIELVNAEDGYGGEYGPQSSTSKVYVTNCLLTPDCDYILTVDSITITNNVASSGSC